jgi:hypothetical protein
MINEPKRSKGIYDFIDQIKETSIRKHYEKPKPISDSMKKKISYIVNLPKLFFKVSFLFLF